MGQFMLAARARADAAAAAAAAAAVAKQKQGQAGGAAAAAAAGAGPGGNDYVARLARRRWDQVRMLVDFHKAHRWVVVLVRCAMCAMRCWWLCDGAALCAALA